MGRGGDTRSSRRAKSTGTIIGISRNLRRTMKRLPGLHVLLGGMDPDRLCELARIAEEEGAAVVQLREKAISTDEILKRGEALRNILHRTTFIVNDHVDIARSVRADVVHLGQGDMPVMQARKLLGPDAIVGVSTSNLEEAFEAERLGANYIGFGHMFPTRSKEKHSVPKTTEELSAIIAAVSIPVIAIGGITEWILNDILVPGLGGIAVISAVSESKNPRLTIRNFVKLLERHHATYA